MQSTVWKFQFKLRAQARIDMPMGAEVLHVGCQTGEPDMLEIWARCDPKAELVGRWFFVCGTGHHRPEIDGKPFVGTVITAGGRLVSHVFEDR